MSKTLEESTTEEILEEVILRIKKHLPRKMWTMAIESIDGTFNDIIEHGGE